MSHRTWHENAKAINQLWQTFQPAEELRKLFRETFERLDQDVLYEAIKAARIEDDKPWPTIRLINTCYSAQVAKRKRQVPRQAINTETRTTFAVPDTEEERKLVTDLEYVIDSSTDEQFHGIEKIVLDRLVQERLASVSAFRLLQRLRVKVFGEGPGLSVVGRDGDLEPLSVFVTDNQGGTDGNSNEAETQVNDAPW